MNQILASTVGIAIGVSFIFFRRRIASLLEKAYEGFPKYKEGISTLNIRLKVRPIFVVLLGLIIIAFSMFTLLYPY